jgi:haloacetate dehalogenase
VFDGFVEQRIDLPGTAIQLVQGGSGPPALRLHGHPRTHVCWHRVAPVLADRFTVVCPDLRGYGESTKPPGDPEHFAYSNTGSSVPRSPFELDPPHGRGL